MNTPDWVPPALLGAALRRSLAAGETLFLREDRPIGLHARTVTTQKSRIALARQCGLWIRKPGNAWDRGHALPEAFRLLVFGWPGGIMAKNDQQEAFEKLLSSVLGRVVDFLEVRGGEERGSPDLLVGVDPGLDDPPDGTRLE